MFYIVVHSIIIDNNIHTQREIYFRCPPQVVEGWNLKEEEG
jgi:hypothetical protein